MKPRIFITSGGTSVPIDDVRSITNMSTGRYGASIADACVDVGCNVSFFGAKGSMFPSNIVLTNSNKAEDVDHRLTCYKDYWEYRDNAPKLAAEFNADIIISTAAVSDYTVCKTPGKISGSDEITLTLRPAAKVLPALRLLNPNSLIVGFKLLVSPSYQEVERAVQRVFNSGVNVVVYNDLNRIKQGDNTRLVFRRNQSSGHLTYVEVADAAELVNMLAEIYSESKDENNFQ